MSNNKSSKLIFMKRAQIAAGLTAILVLSGCGSSSAMNELNLSYEGAKLQFMGDAVQCAKDAQGGLSAVVDQSSTNQADPSVVNLTLIDQGGKPMVNIYANSNKTIVASAAMETTKDGETYNYKGKALLTGNNENNEVDVEGSFRCVTFVETSTTPSK